MNCKKNTIIIGKSKFINCKFSIFGTGNTLIIGDGCVFKDVEFYISDGSSIIIQNNVRAFGPSHLASCEMKKIEIGNDCLISSNVRISNTDSHSIINEHGERINKASDILIGEHVWICNSATILKGTCINSNSIVGCLSLVNATFNEKGVLICGVPASIKKKKINWLDKRC